MNVVNFVLFQLGWFACVLGAANDHPWLGPAAVVAILVIHFLVVSRHRRAEGKLVAVAALFGFALDSAFEATDVLRYEGSVVEWLCPPWIVALWLLFATTFDHSLRWLAGRPWLAAAFGAIGGPLSYGAGARLGALSFGDPTWRTVVITSIAWGALMPAAFAVAQRWVGDREMRDGGGR